MERVNVLYEDNHLLVVQKPPNMPSQKDESGDMDIHTACKAYIGEKYNKPGNVYLGLVHRLDRMVEGVMVFARTSKAAARLSAQLKTGDLKREYLAICLGIVEPAQAVLTHYLAWDEAIRMQRISDEASPQAKQATLGYEVLDIKDGLSLLRVRLQTGRQHQIRAQSAYAGYPLAGDIKYGALQTGDIGLFGARLQLVHPTTREPMTFVAKYPERAPFCKFCPSGERGVGLWNVGM